jgi:hypothetical protein
MLGAKSRCRRERQAFGLGIGGFAKGHLSPRKIQYRRPNAKFLAMIKPTRECGNPAF